MREILIQTYHLPLGRRVNATVPFSDSFSDSTVRVSENARIEIRERLQPSFAVTSPLHKRTDISGEILSKVREMLIQSHLLTLGRRVNATHSSSERVRYFTERVRNVSSD